MSQVPSTVLLNKKAGQNNIQNYSLISTFITVKAHITLFKLCKRTLFETLFKH